MAFTIEHEVTLTSIECSCGGVYAISESFRKEAYRLGNFKKCWMCPYCKTERGYGTGEAQKLKSRVEQLEAQVAHAHDRARAAQNEADYFRKSRDGMKGALVKVKRRVAAGVCPCCARTFQNLHRHMESKHPEYTEAKQ